MQVNTSTRTQWSSNGLLRLLRATLPPAGGRRLPAGSELDSPPKRLSSEQLSALAQKWRRRSEDGDAGAESVAMALEQLAQRRGREKTTKMQAVSRRLSELMQLS
ncbi:hypothetical protein [Variovorax sp. PBS-H4]|uniref:hypothetical protein n=1 Tax=Variovorax sp. PBS-H4 TaxID=434008 RepID=UPI0013A54B09|nr:hypothetical protein [Variovorax sp. PBS-H4]